MPKYVIHIGPPKTGSKYLQSHLFHLRDLLLRDGICYPDNWWTKPDQIMHSPLLAKLQSGDTADLSKTFAELNAAGHKVIVLSCEGFDDLSAQHLEPLGEAIGPHPVEIVYYCRRWAERIPSDWQQHIKMGQFATFPEFYAAYLRAPTHTAAVNYSLVWRNYADVFGRSSLRIVPYNTLRDRRIDIFQHFRETFLGWQGDAALDEGLIQRNISPDLYDTEILRVLNYLYFRESGETSLKMRVKFLELRPQLNTRELIELMSADVAELTVTDADEPFDDAFSAMIAYSDCLVSREFGDQLFERRRVGFRYVRSNYLVESAAVRELSELYAFIERTPVVHPEL
jgi:hypothetical protein